jgi:DNA-binding NtrC family response regulator
MRDDVLLIDDDVDFGTVMRELLESNGYRVRIALDGAQARRALDEGQPRLVLLDWYLTDGSPAELARICHERNIPIVLATASSKAGAQAEEIGAHATLEKPFDIDTLLRLVSEALGQTAPQPYP